MCSFSLTTVSTHVLAKRERVCCRGLWKQTSFLLLLLLLLGPALDDALVIVSVIKLV